MSTLLVGDVHGCAEELRRLLTLADADRVVLVGDLFTKGPDPVGVWEQVRAHRAVLGNHDAWLLEHWDRSPLPESARRWLGGLPLWIEGEGWLAIHAGLNPERGLARTWRQQALNLRRWPDESSLAHPFWWERWSGPPLVVYGHDARRGLVDRRPHSLGLDTGCVYGGRLTGYLLEEDRLLSVSAARVYHAVSGRPERAR